MIAHDFGDLVDVENFHPVARALANLAGVIVKQRNDREVGLFQAVIIGQRSSQAAGADDPHAMRGIQSENFDEMRAQIFDVVTRAAHAELAKVSEILSDLGRIQVELLGQLL